MPSFGVSRIWILAFPLSVASCIPFASIDVHISWSNAILLGQLEAFEREVRGGAPAGADGIQPENEAIRTVLEARKARFQGLRERFERGEIGEGNDARVHVLQGTGADSAKEWMEAMSLAEEENRDREALIHAVASVKSKEISKVRDALALAIERRVEAGWMFQQADGRWVRREREPSGQ